MKLRDIYIICRDNYGFIKNITGVDITINNRQGVKVSNWNKAREALQEIAKIESLKERATALIESVPDFYRTKDCFNIEKSEWGRISIAKTEILRTMKDTIFLYEKMGMDTENKTGIDIKLPHFHDFSEFVKYIDDIDFILTKCPFLQSNEEKLQFENVDVGSTWLTFLVVGSVALTGVSVLLNNMAAFVDKCIVIRSHFLSTQKQKLDLEREKRDDNEKETIQKYIDSLYEQQVKLAIADLEKVTNYKVENNDGDELGRIKQCFERMGDLIDKGLQIKSTIDSPEEAKVLFAPLEMKFLEIDQSLKLLEDNKEE